VTDPLADLPPLPALGPVSRQAPPGGAPRRWLPGVVVEVRAETRHARTLRLELPAGSPAHVPGQHYVVRLRRDDGSWAQRSYSVASAPERGDRNSPGRPRQIELTVERLDDGELSPYLHEVSPGDVLQVRGPFGGWFIWRGEGPALLIGGGSGVVPLMSMQRYWRSGGRRQPLRMVVSVRRLDAATLRPLLLPGATCYVCGSAGFAEHASTLLVELGVPAGDVRVERFGPS